MIGQAFSVEALTAGVLAGVTLAALFRVPAVATTIAAGLALTVVGMLIAGYHMPTAWPQVVQTRVTELAGNGTLTGLLLGKSAAALLDGLVRATRGGRK